MNPYTPPAARVDDIAAPFDPDAPRKRPITVWIICVLIWLAIGLTVFGFYLAYASNLPGADQARGYYQSLSLLRWAVLVIGLLVSLALSIQLFRLKRVAFTLAAIQLTLSVASRILMVNSPESGGAATSWIDIVSSVGFHVFVVIYLWYLRRKNVLR